MPRKNKTIILILIILICLTISTVVTADTSFSEVAAVSAILVERDNGIILYDKDITTRHPNESLTKIMTILLAVEAIEAQRIVESEVIEMTEQAWFDLEENFHTQNILPGQKMTFKDLMFSALTGNAYEACNMIALRTAGSVDAFITMMNAKAAELGCQDTNFVNTHGRYDENQYTCAYDIYLIYNEALKSELFSEIAGTYRRNTDEIGETQSRALVSSNSLLNVNGIYYYRYCQTGVGTGVGTNTYEGGYSLAASAEVDGLTLISVILGGGEVINQDQSVTLFHYSETVRMFLWGFDNFGWVDILRTTDLLEKVPVASGRGADFVNVRPDRAFSMLLDSSVDLSEFKLDITIFAERDNTPLVAPITVGEVLGEVVISRDGIVLDTISLIANTSIEISPLEIAKREISAIPSIPWVRYLIAGLIIIVVIYVTLVIRYNVIRIKRLRRIRDAKKELLREKKDPDITKEFEE